ncbi:MAG: amylo-alpha-1,6-glucosidase [Gemmatimonadota bacterium]|nr:amylo-alpha-1,6-glucosidase [Gemmatimonadota bacterium]
MPDTRAEWLEADGLGGFASGTVGGVRTRRYHALLLSAAEGTRSLARFALVNGVEAWVEMNGKHIPISSQRYLTDITHPDGIDRIEQFTREPWPKWTYRIDDGVHIEQEIIGVRGAPVVALAWRLVGARSPARLVVRPLLSGRDLHSTHRANFVFRFDADGGGGRWSWHPYDGVPRIVSLTNGEYRHDPVWYRGFQYDDERARGLDFTEDLASPGDLTWEMADGGEAILLFAAAGAQSDAIIGEGTPESAMRKVRGRERLRRSRFTSTLHRSAEDYLITRNGSRTIIAGYPWFTDWGRDTFIAMRGLCIETGRLTDARQILLDWSAYVSQGMLPNLFPEHGHAPEYNSVDASLWYVIAAGDFLRAAESRARAVTKKDRAAIGDAVRAIVEGYARGTRFGIRADDDGLLAAGETGAVPTQLTWMDAKVGDRVFTPRVGKPVEVQALWINALFVLDELSLGTPELLRTLDRARASFTERFWNAAGGYLYDVIDVEHVRGATDTRFRPNQIFAAGGLPHALLDADRAREVVDAVEARLLTPIGLRSLAPGEPGYVPHYEGGPAERDAAYHQGTVWPWLIGPFVEAWLHVRGNTPAARAEARARFLPPLLAHLDTAGLGHVSEIADADAPFTPRGCPFQAWSLGALLTKGLGVRG